MMITKGIINGHSALWLENDLLKVTLLPEKGADIYELIYKPDGVDFLMKTPQGLKPPGANPPADFLENYEGCWQELFPNPNDAVVLDGVELPFHGEAAIRPWQVIETSADSGQTTVKLGLDCQLVPFRLERTLRLTSGASRLEVEGVVTNLASTPQSFNWGHHIVLGGGFLQAGCRMEMPECTIQTPPVIFEPETAVLAPSQKQPWPLAIGRTEGAQVDLRHIPGPEAHSHDDVYLTGFVDGWVKVFNPMLGLSFRLEWDARVFGCMVGWRPLGGSDMPPLTGIYGLGVEPWISMHNLSDAIRLGDAYTLQPGASLRTTLSAIISKL